MRKKDKQKALLDKGILLFQMSFKQIQDLACGIPIYDPYRGRYRACAQDVKSWIRSFFDRNDVEEYSFWYTSLPEDPNFGGLHVIAMRQGERHND